MNLLKNKRRIFFIATILLVSFLFILGNFHLSLATDNSIKILDDIKKGSYGLEATAKSAGLEKEDPAKFAGTIIGSILAFVGIIFFGLMVYGGMMWLTARGNEQRVTKAKDIIISAVIGLAIVFISYGVTNLIINRLS